MPFRFDSADISNRSREWSSRYRGRLKSPIWVTHNWSVCPGGIKVGSLCVVGWNIANWRGVWPGDVLWNPMFRTRFCIGSLESLGLLVVDSISVCWCWVGFEMNHYALHHYSRRIPAWLILSHFMALLSGALQVISLTYVDSLLLNGTLWVHETLTCSPPGWFEFVWSFNIPSISRISRRKYNFVHQDKTSGAAPYVDRTV